MQIGITERGDAALDKGWKPWVVDGKPAILITKDPRKLLHEEGLILQMSKVVVHATVTGMGHSKMEPYVPTWEDGLKGYERLVDLLPKNAVVLRIDPIIPTGKFLTHIAPFIKAAQKLKPERVRISFMDKYAHLARRGLTLPWSGRHAPLVHRQKVYSRFMELFKNVEICGEPGMPCTGCVGPKDIQVFDVQSMGTGGYQRADCACLANKKELLTRRGQCGHKCLYCYWR